MSTEFFILSALGLFALFFLVKKIFRKNQHVDSATDVQLISMSPVIEQKTEAALSELTLTSVEPAASTEKVIKVKKARKPRKSNQATDVSAEPTLPKKRKSKNSKN